MKAKRRRFTAACKLRVLEEADACREPGEGAAWWRREGLYSSHLAAWRRAQCAGSMEHSGSGAQGLYRFDANETGYTISTDEGDNRVTVKAGADPVPRYFFEVHADAYGDARQGSGFRAGYGYEKGAQLISRDGHSLFTNSLIPLRAVLGGTAVEYADALIPPLVVVVHLGRGEAVVVMSPV